MPHLHRLRLLDLATNYYDLSKHPESEAKRALQRLVNKRTGKGRRPDNDERPKKKKKQLTTGPGIVGLIE